MSKSLRQSITLTHTQRTALVPYSDGMPHKFDKRPSANLVRRNLLTLAPAAGPGFYQLTGLGRAALQGDAPPPKNTVEQYDPSTVFLRQRITVLRRIAAELRGFFGPEARDEPEVRAILRDCDTLDQIASEMTNNSISTNKIVATGE